MIPKSRPQITREGAEKIIKDAGVDLAAEKCVLVGIRGYYRDSMGAVGENDIGIFDDAFVWIDDKYMRSFNGNNDPSRYYKGVATLKTGVYSYKMGKHGVSKPGGGYEAFRQSAPVRVLRWVKAKVFREEGLGDTINIHSGGLGTSSAGCQTVPKAQWLDFKTYGYTMLGRHSKKTFKYVLVDNPEPALTVLA